MRSVSQPLVVVQVLNYNNEKLTETCLRSLLKSDHPNFRVLLVDNGSEPASYRYLKKKFAKNKSMEIFRLEQNRGFTGGNNHAVNHIRKRYPGAKYVFVLDNDTTIERDALTELTRTAEARPEYGVIGPLVCDYDDHGRVQVAGGKVDLKRGGSLKLHSGEPRDSVRGFFDVDFVPGCCMFIRKEQLENGFLDDRLFTYSEEVDFQLRVRRGGAGIGTLADVCVFHKRGSTTGREKAKTVYYSTRNRVVVHNRWSRRTADNLYFHAYTLFYFLPRQTATYLKRQPSAVRPFVLGIFDGYLKIYDRKVE